MLVRHSRKLPSGNAALIDEIDLQDGDGMCMGIHGWREGDFGEHPPAIVREESPAPKRAVRKSSKKTKPRLPAKKSRRK
jgi:hypothetical protein